MWIFIVFTMIDKKPLRMRIWHTDLPTILEIFQSKGYSLESTQVDREDE